MARADVLARDYLDTYGLLATPIDPTALAEKLGIVVAKTPAAPEITSVFIREPDREIVGVNANLTPTQQRFALAHGIGHSRFSRGRTRVVDSTRRLFASDPLMPTDREEIEANRFATALLLPELAVRDCVIAADCDSAEAAIVEVARAFDVHRHLAAARLLALGILPCPI